MRKNICTQHGYDDCPACTGEFVEVDQINEEYVAEFIPTGSEDGLTMVSDADPGL